jgi:hypothetical protein
MASTTGIRTRHSRTCKTCDGGSCNCEPTYAAFVYSKREGKKIRRSFAGKGAHAGTRAGAATRRSRSRTGGSALPLR